jgi:hypothetical protein
MFLADQMIGHATRLFLPSGTLISCALGCMANAWWWSAVDQQQQQQQQ